MDRRVSWHITRKTSKTVLAYLRDGIDVRFQCAICRAVKTEGFQVPQELAEKVCRSCENIIIDIANRHVGVTFE